MIEDICDVNTSPALFSCAIFFYSRQQFCKDLELQWDVLRQAKIDEYLLEQYTYAMQCWFHLRLAGERHE